MQHRHAIHNHEAHRRVFPGIDHAERSEEEKRNDTPMAAPVVERDDGSDGVSTVFSVVYVTASQTFDGDVASYSTPTLDASTVQPAHTSGATTSAASTATMNADQAAYAAAKSSAANHRVSPASSSRTVLTTATAVPVPSSANEDSSIDATSATSFLTSASSATSSFESEVMPSASSSVLSGPVVGAVSGAPPQATRESSSQTHMPQAIQQTSNGMSGGQQAGLAIGILAAFACAAGLLFFCWRKRKTLRRQKEGQQQLNEKHGSFFGSNQATPNVMNSNRSSGASDKVPASVRSTRTASVAPRLSLRPVTQFLPNLTAGDRKSAGNTLAVAAAPVSEKTSAWERKPSNATEDPFADAAVLSEKEARPASSGSNESKNPFEETKEKTAERSTTPTSDHGKEVSEPPTPKSVKVGTASAVAVGKAGPPAPAQPNNVHRVQLDFKPSMDDELELRSGQLVRILHAYDDGWALCIRMDRSQQGVCPRTCLSNLPVKPRAGPPPPGQRPPPGMRRPSNPNGPMYPRPLTPTNQIGNGPQGNRQRSATASKSPNISDAARNRSTSDAPRPIGSATSMPARKPVPGQAL
ncbi:hypothetical protein K431DRAFT_293457 [Polychaeton citri CBS 116435]|uniref:SH3 domain-containing protein n=1 Tax=Polychaeton citri CBS 116435 TaxID=1314669 RepID=A0A9P4QCD3_9PEZI|nr:hypothetical protein K431DRAFT_293457 [Polychaeton citri CBS 116435]